MASVDHRLADRWHCQIGTAKARRERAITDSLDYIDQLQAMGEIEKLCALAARYEAAFAQQLSITGKQAIDRAAAEDARENVIEAAYWASPCKETARAWLSAMGAEGRANEPAMSALREQWCL